MSEYSREDILKMAEEKNVKFIRMQFTDILGIVKNVAITAQQLEDALDNKIMFDGSSIDGFTRIQESDMYLRPDYDTFTIFPWRPEEGGVVARLICDVYTPTGEPFSGGPRNVLKNALKEAEEIGCQTVNGVGMLINQGAEAFELWTGVDAPIEKMTKVVKGIIKRQQE